MPILKAETELYPSYLLEELSTCDLDRHWWAVHTKSRQEKALARQLMGYEIPFYLPLISHSRLIGGRRLQSRMPLFNGYLFVFATEQERVRALTTKRITQLLPVRNAPELTRDLLNVRNLIAAGAPLSVESRLEPGRRVRVKNGALQGMEGVVLARRGGDCLLVGVQFLQQGVSIQISDFQVEPI